MAFKLIHSKVIADIARAAEVDENSEIAFSEMQHSFRLGEERRRIEFELKVTEAAYQGRTFLVFTDLLVPKERLEKQGFKVTEIIRQAALLKNYELAASNAEYRIAWTADSFITEIPEFHVNELSTLSHRNILISFLNVLWEGALITEETSTSEFENILRKWTNLSNDQIVTYRFMLKSILDDFKSIRMVASQIAPLKQMHSYLPVGVESAFLVSWDGFERSEVSSIEFSARLMNWQSKYWRELIEWLDTNITFEAERGGHLFDFSIEKVRHDESSEFLNCGEYYMFTGTRAHDLSTSIFPIKFLFDELINCGYTLSIIIYRENMEGKILCKSVAYPFDFEWRENDTLNLTVFWV